MWRLTLAAALMAAPIALMNTASADACTYPNSSLGIIQVGLDEGSTFYVDDRNLVLGGGIWIYQESNGVYSADASPFENLQRGGVAFWDVTGGELDRDSCTDPCECPPDTLIF